MINITGKLKMEDKVNEDITLLDSFDNTLTSKRGYVVKMPQKGESVVACLSGGIDSVTNIAMLMKEYGLNVYPFFINRGQSNYEYEKKSADYFNNFFKENFPEQYHDYLEIKVMTPGDEYKDLLRQAKKKVDDLPLRHNVSYPARNPIIFLTGMEYAYSLMSQGITIKTVFASYVSSDTSYHCGQTNTRLMNILMCQIMNDWEWQFISIPTEREFGNFFDKDIYIKWGYENNIPLHKARTCVKKFDIECGDCPTCWDRRRAYTEAGVIDQTEYKFEMSTTYPTYYDHEQEEKLITRI
jgi:7-cyano-7-deazaguanine synthase in queuosine biosynthesis